MIFWKSWKPNFPPISMHFWPKRLKIRVFSKNWLSQFQTCIKLCKKSEKFWASLFWQRTWKILLWALFCHFWSENLKTKFRIIKANFKNLHCCNFKQKVTIIPCVDFWLNLRTLILTQKHLKNFYKTLAPPIFQLDDTLALCKKSENFCYISRKNL